MKETKEEPTICPSECTILIAIQTYEDGKFKLRGRHGYTVYKDVMPFYTKVCEAAEKVFRAHDKEHVEARKEFFNRIGQPNDYQASVSESEQIQK